jgi:hypothetical protein
VDTKEDKKLSPQDAALLNKFNAAIERKRKEMEPEIKQWSEWRRYARNKQHTQDGKRDPDEVRANLILGLIQTLVPLYYAKNPEIQVTPATRIEASGYPAIKTFCKTIELVLAEVFIKQSGLKQKMTRAISSAMTAPAAWLKVIYQREMGTDPIIVSRLNDAQDNLAEIERLIAQAERPGEDMLAKKAELQVQMRALSAQTEVVVEEGLVIDRMLCEEVIVLDDSLQCFGDYEQAKAIAHIVPMTSDDFEARFKRKPTGTKFQSKAVAEQDGGRSSKGQKAEFLYVVELWSKQHQTVFTFEIGASCWAREPYQPQRVGRRWYPFFALYFNDLDGDYWPVPDVSQWTSLQDEYNSMRTQLAQARKDNMPGFMFRKGGSITDKDVENLANRRGRRFIGIEGSGLTTPLEQDLAPFPTVTINPAAYDPTPILRDLEQAAGASDASRQMIVSGKTATEAEIASQGMQSRTGFRVDAIEEMISAMAVYSAQILLMEMTPDQVERITGPGFVWPDMPRSDIYDMVNIEVRGGTSGKPNENMERERWVSLAPELVNLLKEVAMLRQQGAQVEASALMRIFEETLRRFDERIDISEFIPDEVGMGPTQPTQEPVQQPMQEPPEMMRAMPEQTMMEESFNG